MVCGPQSMAQAAQHLTPPGDILAGVKGVWQPSGQGGGDAIARRLGLPLCWSIAGICWQVGSGKTGSWGDLGRWGHVRRRGDHFCLRWQCMGTDMAMMMIREAMFPYEPTCDGIGVSPRRIGYDRSSEGIGHSGVGWAA